MNMPKSQCGAILWHENPQNTWRKFWMPGFRVNTVNFGSEQFDTSTPMAVDFSRTSNPLQQLFSFKVRIVETVSLITEMWLQTNLWDSLGHCRLSLCLQHTLMWGCLGHLTLVNHLSQYSRPFILLHKNKLDFILNKTGSGSSRLKSLVALIPGSSSRNIFYQSDAIIIGPSITPQCQCQTILQHYANILLSLLWSSFPYFCKKCITILPKKSKQL